MIFLLVRLKTAVNLPFFAAAVLIPCIIIFSGTIFGNGGLSINIGVYGDINITGSGEWTVIRYQNREAMKNDVASGRLELAYAAEHDGFTLYTSPATVTDNVANVLVSAAHVKNTAGDIGAAALAPFVDADASEIQARADEILADGPLMERIVVLHGGAADGDFIPFRRLFHGLLALFAQLLAMLCAIKYTGETEKNIIRRLKLISGKKAAAYALSGAAAVFILTASVMLFSTVISAFLFEGVWNITDVTGFLVYLLAISGFATFTAAIIPEEAYPGVIAASFIFTALIGGVFFDLREILEAAAFLRFLFPSYYYMLTVAG